MPGPKVPGPKVDDPPVHPRTEGVGDLANQATMAGIGLSGVNARALPYGTLIGRYVVLKQLGEGGMGVVYAAYDPELNRKVAIKLIRDQSRSTSKVARQRLLREAQAMARLSHPNVISVYDVGTAFDQVFLAMEFIDGGTLRQWLHAKPRTQPEIVAAYVLAGRGLAAAHAAGLVHRDFKPDNVLVSKTGRVLVTDFGLVRNLRDSIGPDTQVEEGAAQLPAARVVLSAAEGASVAEVAEPKPAPPGSESTPPEWSAVKSSTLSGGAQLTQAGVTVGTAKFFTTPGMKAPTCSANLPPTAISYVRVSTLKQVTEGVSLDAQRERLTGAGFKKIAKQLNEDKIAARRGGLWSGGLVSVIMQREGKHTAGPRKPYPPRVKLVHDKQAVAERARQLRAQGSSLRDIGLRLRKEGQVPLRGGSGIRLLSWRCCAPLGRATPLARPSAPRSCVPTE